LGVIQSLKPLMHELLLFKKANADHISSFNLQTPEDDKSLQKTQRKSSRLSDTKENSKRKTILNKAQKLVAKKWGVVEEDQDLNDLTLQQYLDMYKKTLTEESMEAVLKLTEVAKEKKNKKKDSKRKISESSDKLEAKITGKKRQERQEGQCCYCPSGCMIQTVFWIPSVVYSSFAMDNLSQHYKFFSWNVRGLNNVAKQEEVRQVINTVKPNLICLQETKLSAINQHTIRSILGRDFENSFVYLPAEGTRGGILLASKDSDLLLQQPALTTNTISATVLDLRANGSWTVTGVYGPQGDLEKRMFIRELRGIKQEAREQWLILGDFNLIYKSQDKNNGRVNRQLMTRFRRALNFLEVKEIELVGRKYTWSNGQSNPTLSRIDRAFCTIPWEDLYFNPILQPLSSSISDHCPLLLGPLSTPALKPKF
jgi:exonuclease III